MQWISVQDRLPERTGFNLVAIDGGKRVMTLLYRDTEKAWEWLGSLHRHRITHWMPLPDPPRAP